MRPPDSAHRTVHMSLSVEGYSPSNASIANEMHFVKTSYDAITEANIATALLQSSLRASPVLALSSYLQEVFVPLFLGDPKWAATLESGRLPSLIHELSSGLAMCLRRGAGDRTKGPLAEEADLSGILTPLDEARYWKDAAAEKKDERSRLISDSLEAIASSFAEDWRALSFAQLLELGQELQEALNELWQLEVSPPYPETRMHNLLGALAGVVCRTVQSKLGGIDIWEVSIGPGSGSGSSSAGSILALREALRLCDRWTDLTADLTGTDWKGKGGGRDWTQATYVDTALAALAGRLQAIVDLKTENDQVSALVCWRLVHISLFVRCFAFCRAKSSGY